MADHLHQISPAAVTSILVSALRQLVLRVPVSLHGHSRLVRPILILSTTLCLVASIFAQPAARQSDAGQANFDAFVKAATVAREAGLAGEAIRNYQRAVEIHPGWQEGWWYLGTLQYDADRYAEAIPAFQRLVRLAPEIGPARNFLGLCEFETQDYANSREHLEQGQALGAGDDPEIARVSQYHLALLLNRNAEFERATAMLVSAFGQSQFPAQAKLALGLALLRVPLLPSELDPSQDALVQAAGEAAALVVRGESAKALNSFQALLKDYPRAPYLHYAYGIALAASGNVQEALIQLRAETAISPRSALPQIEISRLEFRLQHPQEASRAAQETLRLAPDSSAAHQALGESLEALGKKEAAREQFAAARRLTPERPEPDAAVAQLYALHSTTGSTQTVEGNADEPWNLAMQDYSSARYLDAIAALKTWVERHPNYGTAWAVMGLSEFALKDYNNAFIHLQRGQELGLGGSTESVQLAKYRLGILLNRNGQFDRTIALLGSEAGSGSLASEIQFALGMALLRIPLLPEQVAPAKDALVQTAGETAALLQDSKYDQAFPKFQSMLKSDPSTPFLHYAYATALASLSQYKEAEAEAREEVRVSPNSELPHVLLASLALRQHRAADALPSAQRAVQLAPDSAEAHYVLGRAYLELGPQERAVQELEAAGKITPGSPEIHFNLAKAYAKAKLPEKAEQERAIFARLNALAEQQRSLSRNQSYGGSHGPADLSPTHLETNPPVAPQR